MPAGRVQLADAQRPADMRYKYKWITGAPAEAALCVVYTATNKQESCNCYYCDVVQLLSVAVNLSKA